MLEIVVATGLLAMFMSSIFYMFKSGTDSFNAGTWRVENQKKLQRFLVVLRDSLEKANYAQVINANGKIAAPVEIPIYIRKAWHNTTGSCRSTAAWILFSAITDPYREGQSDLGTVTKAGAWSGIVLYCNKGKLILKRNGDWNKIAVPYSPPTGLRPSMTQFPAKVGADFQLTLDDVENLQISESVPGTGEDEKTNSVLTITITLRRYVNGVPKEARITKTIYAKLLERKHKIEEKS